MNTTYGSTETARFIKQHGGNYVQYDDTLYFRTGAVIYIGMPSEFGRHVECVEPPINNFNRIENQIMFWDSVRRHQEELFHKLKAHIAEDPLQYSPGQIRSGLKKQRDKVRAVRDKLKELREEKAKTPEGRRSVEQRRQRSEVKAIEQEAKQALKSIKI